MDELDVVLTLNIRDQSHVGDLLFLLPGGKENQVTRLHILHFDLLPHGRLVAGLAWKLNFYGSVGRGCECAAIHP